MSSPKEIAPGIAVTAQPDAAGIAGLAGQGFRTIINNRPDGEEPGQISASAARSEAERLGLAYIHIPVTSGTITADDVAAFDRAVRESPKPTVAHCRSGTRTYLLWAAAQAIHHGADPRSLMADAAAKGYELKSLPNLVARLKSA